MRVAVSGWRLVGAAALLVACLLGLPAPASAQYFGQNKVQYHSLKYEVLKTEHFDIYFYPDERAGVAIAARLAERWHARFERVFEHRLRGRQPLILYASHSDFEQTNVISGRLTEGTGGVTEPLRRRIVLPLGGPIAETDHVIGHELVHAFQFDLTTVPESAPGTSGLDRLPLWFIEGMAEYLSLGPVDPNTAMWLRDSVIHEKLPAIKDLGKPRYFPYRWGQAFWAYVCGRWSDRVIGTMLDVASAEGGTDVAIERVLGVKPEDLSKDWHASIRKTYAAALEVAGRPDARLVVQGKELGGELNVGPSISPDGRLIAFLSERGFFSADLYVADAATGRIIHRLTSTATNPHFSSIQFIYSAGAWDAASRRIAVASVISGHAALAVFDAVKGTKEREIAVPSVDEIFNPTWAPDGHGIAFTGMKQGLTDLFVYDFPTGTLRRLTDDAYADVQPAWSPDGRRIAFATDRFTTDLATLGTGAYRIALFDLEDNAIAPVAAFVRGKHLDPQWSPDGRSLYFISDRDGIPNVYRVALATGELAQVTSVATGVSGITNTSPALSVASASGAVAFSIYEDGKYDIYAMESPAGGPLAELGIDAGVLPPKERGAGEVAALLANPSFGLAETGLPSTPYKPKLSLEAAGQPMMGAGVGRFGPTISGGVSLYFSDVLGNHLLATAFGLNTGWNGQMSAKDISGQAAYVNRERRWNWGLIGGQIPYLSAGFITSSGYAPDGDLIQTEQMITYRQTEQNVSGFAAYPLDRARRIELQAGASHISYDRTVTTTTYSLYTGTIYEDSSQTMPFAQSMTIGTSSAAYVFDTANYGPTSPVQGRRLRLEASPVFGTINFTGVLADYRRYFMPVPFYTLAVRAMHYGRYGSGAEDIRLFPVDIGYPGLVRGYDSTTFDASDCVPTAASYCPVYDRLIGSRMLVGNVEFRFPLLRPLGVSRNMYGPVPVEVALFGDAGTAWTSGQRPSLFRGSRDGVVSAGVALRINLFSVLIGEFDIVKPFQRPATGWTFSFNLLQGW